MSPNDLVEQLQSQDYDFYLNKLLDKIPEDIDKREGSVIFDAVAPAAIYMAYQNTLLANIIQETYIKTASDEFLDYRAVEHGTQRYPATKAQVTAKFLDKDNQLMSGVDVGDRFASIGDKPIFYTVKQLNQDLTAILEAEITGSKPNSYLGQILPVTPNDTLYWAEIVEITTPARDAETDDHLRQRLLSADNYLSYGGNIADYLDMVSKIDTVGAVQVYPVWNGGGTVKLVILDNDLMPASSKLLADVKEQIDPNDSSGQGYGLAPIDHTVTVVAPTAVTIDIDVTLKVNSNTDIAALHPQISAAIEDYFVSERQAWSQFNHKTGRGYSLTVYRSQILKAILNVDGVIDSQTPTLNGQDNDLVLIENNQESQLPILGQLNLINRNKSGVIAQ